MAVGLVPIARRTFVAARFGTPFSTERLMTIGVTEGATMAVFLFLIGELLGASPPDAPASIQGLTNLVPKMALLKREGNTS